MLSGSYCQVSPLPAHEKGKLQYSRSRPGYLGLVLFSVDGYLPSGMDGRTFHIPDRSRVLERVCKTNISPGSIGVAQGPEPFRPDEQRHAEPFHEACRPRRQRQSLAPPNEIINPGGAAVQRF